jgi:phage gp29-like protein
VKKAVIPSIVAIYKAGKNKGENEAAGALIAKELSKLANSSGIALTNVESLETVDPTSKGKDIIDLTEMFNRMISKAFLGTSTLTNEARFSSGDTADTSIEIVQDRSKKVAVQEIQPSINVLLKWTAELNQGEIPIDKIPLFKFIYEYDPSFDEVMKATTNGIAISGKWFYEKFNIKRPDDENDILVKPVAPVIPSVNASTKDSGFFLRSEPPKNKPPMTKTISKILSSIMAKR